MTPARHGLLLGALAALGCQPDLSGSVEAYVYRLDTSTQSYGLVRDRVDHLESLRALRGRDLDVRSASELNLGLAGEEARLGGPFSLEFSVDAEGVVVPGDLHSLYGLSTYRNLDRAAQLLRAHGHVPRARLNVLYYPRLDNVLLGDTRGTFTDNAAFSATANGFLILPSLALAEVPMFLNEGVMAHEFGHAVIHQELFAEGALEPERDTHLAAMHEGVADLLGFAATGDPNYISPTAEVDRDLAVPRDYTEVDLQELVAAQTEDLVFGAFDPHLHGSTMARAIYELWPKEPDGTVSELERGRLIELLLAALRARPYVQGEFTLASVPDALIPLLPAAEQPAACAVLLARLAPLADRLTQCGAP